MSKIKWQWKLTDGTKDVLTGLILGLMVVGVPFGTAIVLNQHIGYGKHWTLGATEGLALFTLPVSATCLYGLYRMVRWIFRNPPIRIEM